jgi:hypothetical protein
LLAIQVTSQTCLLQESFDIWSNSGIFIFHLLISNKYFDIQVTSQTCLLQELFDFGITNTNPTMTATLPSGGSPAVNMPPILGTYTSMLFEVQRSSAALSSSTDLHYHGFGGLNDTMDQS